MASRIQSQVIQVPLGKQLVRRRRSLSTPTLRAPGQRQPRVRRGIYVDQIRMLPCLISGITDRSEAAHVRYGDPAHDKRPTGMGEKPDDRWCVPLSAHWHRLCDNAQHRHNERNWWKAFDIDPLKVCIELWEARNNFAWMEEVVEIYRPRHLPFAG